MVKTAIYIFIFCSTAILQLSAQDTFVPYREGNKWGMKSYETQTITVKPKYKMLNPFVYKRALFQKGNKYGYIDEQGKEVIKATYTSATNFGCYSLARVTKKGKRVIITINGEKSTILPIDCDMHGPIFYGYPFLENGKYGYARMAGDTLLPAQYDEIREPHYYQQPTELHLIVRKGRYWGIVKQSNSIVLPLDYEDITDTYEMGGSFAVLQKNGLYGAYCFKTGVLISAEYLSIMAYYKMVRVEISPGVFGYIDDQGRKYWN